MYLCGLIKICGMKHYILSVLWLFFALTLPAQNPTCYRIYLSDKANSPYSIDNPSAYLSQRAIDKRERFDIPITEQDLPVNPQYKQQILALDAEMQLQMDEHGHGLLS